MNNLFIFASVYITADIISLHRSCFSYLRSVSGTLDVMEELVEVRVVTDGGRTGNDSPESHFTCI